MFKAITVVVAILVAMSFAAPSHAAYSATKNYNSKPAAAKSSGGWFGGSKSKSKSSYKSKSGGYTSSFKSGGYKK